MSRWTLEHTNANDPVHNQRQRDDILAAAKESLGAVDRIQRPEPFAGAAATAVDPLQDVVGRTAPVHLSHEVNDTGRYTRKADGAQCRGIFFRHEDVAREISAEAVWQ